MFSQMLTFPSDENIANLLSSLVKFMVHYCFLDLLYCGAAWQSYFLSSYDLVSEDKLFIPYPSAILKSSKIMHQGSISTRL